MDSVFHSAVRQWIAEDHLRNVLESGMWIPMLDSDGKPLSGIRGKSGASGPKPDGSRIGVDLIEMQPGTRFELHVHKGEHILFIESGIGSVHIDGVDHPATKGATFYIPGEYTHGVVGPPLGTSEPLVIISFGHPHKDIGAPDRMQHPHDHEH